MSVTQRSEWQCRKDDITGSIEPGKCTDFAVLLAAVHRKHEAHLLACLHRFASVPTFKVCSAGEPTCSRLML